MKSILTAVVTSGLLVLAGCVVTSVHPYYKAEDVTFEAKLLGRWSNPAEPDTTNAFWEFARGADFSYVLTVQEGEKQTPLQAHLFRLERWTFLDVMPTEAHDDFIPPHYLLKVVQIEPALKMEMLNYNWLGDLIKKEPATLQHIYVGAKSNEPGRLVLTASTAELQKFILQHADNTNAFTDGVTLERKR